MRINQVFSIEVFFLNAWNHSVELVLIQSKVVDSTPYFYSIYIQFFLIFLFTRYKEKSL